MYEAVRFSVRPGSPDHEYYLRVAARVGAQRATLAVARKLARRCQHRLRVLGEQAFAELPGHHSSLRPARWGSALAGPFTMMACGPLRDTTCLPARWVGQPISRMTRPHSQPAGHPINHYLAVRHAEPAHVHPFKAGPPAAPPGAGVQARDKQQVASVMT